MIAGSIIALMLIIFSEIFISKHYKPGEPIEKSIAVLPFKLLSDEPDKQYLADGMMDAITLHLSKIRDLRVMSRTSVEQYNRTTKTTRQIGKELDVEYLLEGSFQKFGDKTKLIVQLIKAKEEKHAWANEYDSKWSDVFSLQSDVAVTIARELNAIISPEEKRLIEKIPTNNLQAYDYYLLGEHLRSQHTPESLRNAKTYYEKSLGADPGFIKAYSGLANCYGNLAFWTNLRPEEAYPPALKLAQTALGLDSLFAEAYNIIGMVDLYYNFDFVSAEKNYKRAMELDPDNLENYRLYSELLFDNGQFYKAVEMNSRALAIDPIYPFWDFNYGLYLYYVHQKDSAVSHLTKMSERYPVCHFSLGIINCMEGEYKMAIEELKKIASDFSPVVITYLGLAYSKSGDLYETKRMLDTLESRAKKEYVPYSMRGALFAEIGKDKEALNYLRKGYDNKEEFLLLLNHADTISYSNLRNTAEFIKIMGKIRVTK